MSEKRFKIIENFEPLTIVDFKNGKHYNVEEVVDLLNSFSDVVLAYDKRVAELKRENEQLQYKYDFQMSLAEAKIKNREKEIEKLKKEKEILKEENEQLKQENKALQSNVEWFYHQMKKGD